MEKLMEIKIEASTLESAIYIVKKEAEHRFPARDLEIKFEGIKIKVMREIDLQVYTFSIFG